MNTSMYGIYMCTDIFIRITWEVYCVVYATAIGRILVVLCRVCANAVVVVAAAGRFMYFSVALFVYNNKYMYNTKSNPVVWVSKCMHGCVRVHLCVCMCMLFVRLLFIWRWHCTMIRFLSLDSVSYESFFLYENRNN